eukprot:evm.model.scf_575EXC.1 EVM.evm.TU.scf_575EXC.1   scf_575EXC:791-1858(-)
MDGRDHQEAEGLWKQGAPAKAGQDRMEDYPCSEQPSCKPWDGWLAFLDPDLETEFWQLRAATVFKGIDCIAYGYSFLYFISMEFQFSGFRSTPSGMARGADVFPAIFFILVAWAAVESYLWSDRYKSHRALFVGGIRILAITFCLRYASVFDSPTATFSTFCHDLFRKSTLTVMAISPTMLPLSFRLHTAVSGACLMVALFWATPNYCRAWTDSEEFISAVALMERVVNALMMLGGGGDTQSDGQIQQGWSCFLVVAFAHVVLGFIVPTAVVYGTECCMRCQFLLRKFPSGRRFCLPEGRGLALLIIGSAAVAASTAWVVLKVLVESVAAELDFGAFVSSLAEDCAETQESMGEF